jgi:regulator of replication initiation timing
VDLIEEHLREVRCLRQRLEETIRTNEKLRQQLEERLATTGRDGGAPTNIYIQGVDSVSQLSNEIRVLKEENLALQAHLQASSGTASHQPMLWST